MGKLYSLVGWTWTITWPILLLAIIIILHILSLSSLDIPASDIHKLVALCTQIVGGLLILYSIDSNIGIYKNKNLVSFFWLHLKKCPLLEKKTQTTRQSSSWSVLGVSGSSTAHKKPESVEEKVDLLEIQLNELRAELRGNHNKLYFFVTLAYFKANKRF